VDDEQFSRLVDSIYDSVLDPDAYDQAMEQVLAATGSHFLLLSAALPGERAHVAPRFIGEMSSRRLDGIAEYAAGASAEDLTLAFVAANPTAGLFSTTVNLDYDDPATRRYVNWNRHYLGNAHWQARYQVGEGMLFGAALHTRSPDQPHSADEQRNFSLLFGHMARAQRLASRAVHFAANGGAMASLNAAGKVLALSPAAVALVERGDGLQLHHGELLPRDRRLWAEWREMMRAVMVGSPPGADAMQLPRGYGKRPLAVTVSAQARPSGFGGLTPGAFVRIIDPETMPTPLFAQLTKLWRLTPAEVRLVQVVVENGFDLREAADRLGITYATVRTQLASVYAKTDTRGQPELMRLVTRLSA